MCEPTHSIIQIPLKIFALQQGIIEEQSTLLSAQFCLGESKRQLLAWSHQTRDYLHLSRMGQGHSESIQLTTNNAQLFPDHVKYEGLWWERKTRLDEGTAYGFGINIPEGVGVHRTAALKKLEAELKTISLEAATNYARRQSYGSIPVLQKFLMESLRRTERPYMYIREVSEHLLSDEGKASFQVCLDQLDPGIWISPKDIAKQYGTVRAKQGIKKLKQIRAKRYQEIIEGGSKDTRLAALIDGVTHVTSHRRYMNSTWADDKECWHTSGKLVDTPIDLEFLSTHRDCYESEGAEGWDALRTDKQIHPSYRS